VVYLLRSALWRPQRHISFHADMSISAPSRRPATLAIKAKLLSGLAEPSRLAILEALRNGALTVGELVQRTGLSQPNTSNHLACLADCQLVEREPDGRYARYRLKHARVEQILVLADALLLEIGSAIAACPRTGAPINGSAGRRSGS
jgi:DNA-binding transcriptional ArsR family regulator